MTIPSITLSQLESHLWESANILRGPVDAADFKSYVFPLLFFKRISDVHDEEHVAALKQFDGDEEAALFPENYGFQIPEDCHWRDVREVAVNVGQALQTAMRGIEQANPHTLYGIFGDAQWTNKDRLSDALLKNLIEHFSRLSLGNSAAKADVLGQSYEYLIKKFADATNKKAGEFYTPRSVVRLMVNILDPRERETLYDPACGTGGMLIKSIQHVKEAHGDDRTLRGKLYGQEKNLTTSAIARMNLFLHGAADFQIVRGDTLRSPAFFLGDSLATFDCVIANPPFSLEKWGDEVWASNPSSLQPTVSGLPSHPRPRFRLRPRRSPHQKKPLPKKRLGYAERLVSGSAMNRQSHRTPSADSPALPDARSRSIRPWCGVRANNFPRTYVHRFVSRMCRGILTAGTVGVILAAASTLAANKIPTKLPNGEIPWEPINDANLQKIVAALPAKPQVPPLKPRKLLVFYRTDRFVHGSIPEWNKMLELLGEKTGAYRATLSQSYDDLTPERLKEFDAVFFNNTCRMMTPEPVKAALMDFVKSGKGFAGNHGSGDNWQDWGDGRDMLGAVFNTHPFGSIQIKIDDSRSPLTAVFGGKAFPFSDEIYAFTAPYSREKLRVLLSVDHPNSPNVQKEEQKVLDRTGGKPAGFVRPDHDYAISWIRAWGNGRVFYCSLGHGEHVTWDPAIVRFNLAGIQYALGDLKADDTPVK